MSSSWYCQFLQSSFDAFCKSRRTDGSCPLEVTEALPVKKSEPCPAGLATAACFLLLSKRPMPKLLFQKQPLEV